MTMDVRVMTEGNLRNGQQLKAIKENSSVTTVIRQKDYMFGYMDN